MSDRLHLPGVTACAVDTRYPELAARALELSIDQCRFTDAILFTDREIKGRFRCVRIPTFQVYEDVNRFYFQKMVDWIETPYALNLQWDGYVVDAGAWSPRFLKFDYIGATVPPEDFARLLLPSTEGLPEPGDHLVGNGGFSLRSRKLMEAVKSLPFLPRAEDWLICVLYRQRLVEEFGIRFAPARIASRFAYDACLSATPTFGFHGPYNLWRHHTDREVLDVYSRMPASFLLSRQGFVLLLQCLRNERIDLAASLYGLLRAEYERAQIDRRMVSKGLPQDLVTATLVALEEAWRSRSPQAQDAPAVAPMIDRS